MKTESGTANSRVLGIDPGLNVTGYAVLDSGNRRPRLVEAGVVRGGHGLLEDRLVKLYDGIAEVIATFHPTQLAIEELYSHYKRPRTAILMGHARGTICLAAGQKRIPVHHYAATQIKKVLTGNGRAPKQQVQLAVCREFSLSEVPEPVDVSDAMAIALCHVHLQNSLGQASITRTPRTPVV